MREELQQKEIIYSLEITMEKSFDTISTTEKANRLIRRILFLKSGILRCIKIPYTLCKVPTTASFLRLIALEIL
jgi:hypothetical protein